MASCSQRHPAHNVIPVTHAVQDLYINGAFAASSAPCNTTATPDPSWALSYTNGLSSSVTWNYNRLGVATNMWVSGLTHSCFHGFIDTLCCGVRDMQCNLLGVTTNMWASGLALRRCVNFPPAALQTLNLSGLLRFI